MDVSAEKLNLRENIVMNNYRIENASNVRVNGRAATNVDLYELIDNSYVLCWSGVVPGWTHTSDELLAKAISAFHNDITDFEQL